MFSHHIENNKKDLLLFEDTSFRSKHAPFTQANEPHSHIAVKCFGKRPLKRGRDDSVCLGYMCASVCLQLFNGSKCWHWGFAQLSCDLWRRLQILENPLVSVSFTYRYFLLALRPDLSSSPPCYGGDLNPCSWNDVQSFRLCRDTRTPTKITKHHVSTLLAGMVFWLCYSLPL